MLELGAGCGLPGIVAAKFARHVVLTDYVDDVLRNLEYNIKLNRYSTAPPPWVWPAPELSYVNVCAHVCLRLTFFFRPLLEGAAATTASRTTTPTSPHWTAWTLSPGPA